MGWILWAGLGLAVIVVAFALLGLYGAARWERATRSLLERLEASRGVAGVATFDPRELDGLPPPVRRYFEAALSPGQAMVSAVSVDHGGTFNLSENGERWAAFTSKQRVVTRKTGFVWDGRIAVAPGVAVRVHDAYVAGEGILHPALLGLVTLVNLRGTPEVARGELMRYLAEAAWYPTALLPSQGVSWEALDDRSARATLVDGAVRVSLTFHFGTESLIESVRAERRDRLLGGMAVPTPWEGRWTDYRRRDGMLVPHGGEVAWILPEGRKPYWRGSILALAYEFAK